MENAIVNTEIQQETSAVLSMIERAASDPNVDVMKMEKLLDMQERVLNRQAESEFFRSLNVCQSGMTRVSTDRNNGQTKSKYASYAALDRVLRPIYTDNGLCLSFDTEPSGLDGILRVVCYVSNGNYTKRYSVDMPADGKGAKGGDVMTKTHATGAAASYGMRYLLKMIFNVAIGEDDTDGNMPEAKNQVLTIDKDQTFELMALINKAGITPQQFCEKGRVDSIHELPANRFDAAKNSLVRQIENKGEAKSENIQ